MLKSWSTKKHLGWALASVLSLGPTPDALACEFHGYTPDPTLVDLLLATEQAVIARPTSRGTYKIVDALLGPDLGEVPVPVSLHFRTQLEGDKSATALLVRDGAYGPWIEVALLDPQFRSIIQTVVQNQSAWQLGRDAGRIQVFAALVNDPNPNIQRLALQELDRLPYATLKGVNVPPIRGLLENIEAGELDQRPIRILLAGLSNDRSFGPVLANALHQAVLQDKAYLGAYVTALIELQGKPAVEAIVAHYLSSGATSQGVQEKLLDALALQYKTSRGPTSRTIAREMASLVREKPEMADLLIAQFGPQVSGRLLR
ncbi:MAG: hypothetical protein ACEPO2_15695 [Pelagibaca sp.]